jgi:hypothetical protein
MGPVFGPKSDEAAIIAETHAARALPCRSAMSEAVGTGAVGTAAAIGEAGDELVELLEKGDHAEVRFGAAMQLFGMGRGADTVEALGRLVEAPVGEHRTRAAAQLARIGLPSIGAYRSLVRAAVNRDDDGLALTAIETLNAIDPENLVGAPQVVRLLRRRVLRMWRGGAFLRVAADEAIFVRLVEALAINGRYYDDARYELEHLAGTTTGRVQAIVRKALASFDPPGEMEAKSDP